MKHYETEVRQRWGNTAAYREHEEKTKGYSTEKWAEVSDGLMAIFAEFAECRKSGAAADSVEARGIAAKLQTYITENFYTCTCEMLAGLGQMYGTDQRFRENIDRNEEGTAAFACEAISAYVQKKGDII